MSKTLNTPITVIDGHHKRLRDGFRTGFTRPMAWRKEQIKAMLKMIKENQKLFGDALHADLNRSEFEGLGLDVLPCIAEIELFLKNLDSWNKPVTGRVPVTMAPATAEFVYEPFGVCLIIGPFNFPIFLIVSPILGAIAAGNCVVVKPSELATHCEKLFADLIPKYMDPRCIQVVTGGVETNQHLLSLKWDKIFFTGSPRVGKIVMKAAAEHLTPVCLELGGKSPTIVGDSYSSPADLEVVARRIIWGRCINAGQVCVSPDYVFCHEKVYDDLLIQLKKTIITFYTENPEKSPDLCRLISEQHCQRMAKLIKKCNEQGNIYYGGVVDTRNRFCSPTIVTDITIDSDIMKEEIFGPILPIMKYSNIDTVIETLLTTPDLENPLALYIFSKNKKFNDHIINRVPSGAAVVNDSIFHVANLNIPFGGRGTSGMGQYHGKFSFETFSHMKSILRRDDSKLLDLPIRYPPYTDTGFKIFKLAFALPDLPAVTRFQLSVTVMACALAGVLIGLGVTGRFK